MPKDPLFAELLKDSNKLKTMYDTLFDTNDLFAVDLKAEKVINANSIVPEESIVKHNMFEERIRPTLSYVYVSQKWFMLAKALLVADLPQYNAILYKKLGYDPVDEEYAMLDYKDKIENQYSEDEEQPSEKEIELNAKAMCLADAFLENQAYRAEFSRQGQFENIINAANNKKPGIFKDSNQPELMQVLLSSKMNYYHRLQGEFALDDLASLSDTLRTKSQVADLKATNAQLLSQKTTAEAELSAKENIRTLQQERNSKSIFWKIFRPISNLISYFSLKNARNNYKENFILPKLEEYKGNDDYNEKLENAINNLNEEINSDKPLTSSMPIPKAYTAKDLKKLDIDDIGNNNKNISNQEELNESLNNDIEKQSELNESMSSQYSKDDINIDLDSSKLGK